MLQKNRALVVSLLLLLLAFAGGWAGVGAEQRAALTPAETRLASAVAGEEECVAAVWQHGYEALHQVGHGTPTAAKSSVVDGGDAPRSTTREAMALLPAAFSLESIHSKAALKQRRYALLSRTEWQQRLALFPKHGFW